MIFMGCKAFFQEDATPLFGTSWGSACDQPLLSSVLPGAAHAISHSSLRYFLGQRMRSATPVFGTSWGSACNQPLLSLVLPEAAHAISHSSLRYFLGQRMRSAWKKSLEMVGNWTQARGRTNGVLYHCSIMTDWLLLFI